VSERHFRCTPQHRNRAYFESHDYTVKQVKREIIRKIMQAFNNWKVY